jgi:hypothetical protein
MPNPPIRSLVALPALFAAASLHAAPVTLTHSASMTTTQGGFWCGNLSESANNAWGRTFDLASFGVSGSFDVQSVTFGVGVALANAGQQAVSVKVYDGYTTSGFSVTNRGTLVGSFTQQIANGANFNLTWNVPATVASGFMYVEVESLNPGFGSGSGTMFQVGTNSAGETSPTYLWAPSCGANNPLANTAIGFPSFQMVLSVTGTDASVIPSPLAGALGFAGLLGVASPRRRR